MIFDSKFNLGARVSVRYPPELAAKDDHSDGYEDFDGVIVGVVFTAGKVHYQVAPDGSVDPDGWHEVDSAFVSPLVGRADGVARPLSGLDGVVRAPAKTEADEHARLAKVWQDTANYHARNEQFYHDLVCEIGDILGRECRRKDDGTYAEDVLALRVPEVAAQVTDELRRFREHLDDIRCDILDTGWPLGDDSDPELTPRRLVGELLEAVARPKVTPPVEAEPSPFAAGDLVRLRSGGPEMTVESVEQCIYVVWYDGVVQRETFAPEVLVPAEVSTEVAARFQAATARYREKEAKVDRTPLDFSTLTDEEKAMARKAPIYTAMKEAERKAEQERIARSVILSKPGEGSSAPCDIDYRAIALILYCLLDDISTLDDACRENDAAFRKRAAKLAERRSDVGGCFDGQTVCFVGEPAYAEAQRRIREDVAVTPAPTEKAPPLTVDLPAGKTARRTDDIVEADPGEVSPDMAERLRKARETLIAHNPERYAKVEPTIVMSRLAEDDPPSAPGTPLVMPMEPDVTFNLSGSARLLSYLDAAASTFTLYSPDGGTRAVVDLLTGEVTVVGDVNEAARAFWGAVEAAFPGGGRA